MSTSRAVVCVILLLYGIYANLMVYILCYVAVQVYIFVKYLQVATKILVVIFAYLLSSQWNGLFQLVQLDCRHGTKNSK